MYVIMYHNIISSVIIYLNTIEGGQLQLRLDS